MPVGLDPVQFMNFSSGLILTWCAAMCLHFGAVTRVQKAPVSDELARAISYRDVVMRYRAGDADTIAAAIAIPRAHLESIVKVIFSSDVHGTKWTADELRGSAMLHTDAALRVVELHPKDTELFERHLSFARHMLHASSPPDDRFVPRWYYSVSLAFCDRRYARVAETLLARGRTTVPGEPTILFASAMVAEIIARGRLISTPDAIGFHSSAVDDTARSVQQRTGLLNDAVRWLGQALERDDTMLMARLRLGRVETLLGREQDGLVQLDRVLRATTDAAMAYLAALFSGAAHERLRRPEAAEAAYRQAIARFPAGQAAYVALSEVLQRSGKADESREVLNRLLNRAADSVREPWWWYLADPPGVANERLAELRREVRR
jgi:tetratricopeptide (TPR) repeat protein